MDDKKEIPEKPPFFQSWRKLYWTVIGIEVVLIILFHLFTQTYSWN